MLIDRLPDHDLVPLPYFKGGEKNISKNREYTIHALVLLHECAIIFVCVCASVYECVRVCMRVYVCVLCVRVHVRVLFAYVYVYMYVWTCAGVPVSPIPAEVLRVREVAESLMVFGRENNI